MPASHSAFEHFVRTGELNVVLTDPKDDSNIEEEAAMPRLTPYFTYEVGIDEPAHPDRDIAMRFVEVAMSDCKYGCKIYADPFSEVRVLVHSQVYGCRRTMAVLELEREDRKIRPGDTVEFADSHDPLVMHTGKVLNLIAPDDEGFSEALRIGCYFIVDTENVRAVDAAETYQQAYERFAREGILDEASLASYFGISVESLRELRLKKPVEYYDGTEFNPGDMVEFSWFKDSTVKHVGQIIGYISPQLESGELSEETYGSYHIRTDERDPDSGNRVFYSINTKGSLSLAK